MRMNRRAVLEGAGVSLAGAVLWTVTFGSRSAEAGPGFGPPTRPSIDDAHLAELVRANTEFTLALHEHLVDEEPDTNLLSSPVSLSVALAMTWAGARGETEAQMAETLRFPFAQDDLHPAVGAHLYELNQRVEAATDRDPVESFGDRLRGADEPDFELSLANALWGLDDYPYREAFLKTVEANYGAGLHTVDFSTDPDGAREEINAWTADETNGRIDELLPPESIDELTRLVLTNAIYLLADWATPFDPADTTDEPFTPLDGSTEEVAMMDQTETFPYARVDGHQVVELPYVGEDVSMVIILPEEGAFERFERDLDVDHLARLVDELDPQEVRLTLPRFEVETEFSLKGILNEMGMPVAFDPPRANFDGIAPLDEIGGNLYIDDVYHDAYVAVDEEGTEAAGASGVVVNTLSGSPSIIVDRPFLFLIRDRPTGAVLFLGRMVDAPAGP